MNLGREFIRAESELVLLEQRDLNFYFLHHWSNFFIVVDNINATISRPYLRCSFYVFLRVLLLWGLQDRGILFRNFIMEVLLDLWYLCPLYIYLKTHCKVMIYCIETWDIVIYLNPLFIQRRVITSFLLESIPWQKLLDIFQAQSFYKLYILRNRLTRTLSNSVFFVDSFDKFANPIIVLEHSFSLLVSIHLWLIPESLKGVLLLVIFL